MPMKGSGPARDVREIDRFADGVGWIAHPNERMERASHALVTGEDVWLIDPLDAEGLEDLLADLGTVSGVVVLLDRHTRDASALARRYDVSVHLPAWMDGVARKLDAPVERSRGRLADTDYRFHRVLDTPFWTEAALATDETLFIPEAVGTASYFSIRSGGLGVHPMLRATPPRRLRRFSPDRILLGHGPGVDSGASTALTEAIRTARRTAPHLYARTTREFLPW
jgi:hypothetical protein